ncbi:MAG: ABC transporter ATP-binding protein [Desulfobacterales bacterium]|nr:ABC transporter ATP-binding protein [Desulfobacterales bacterium]
MIVVENITKIFKLYRSPADRLKEIVLRKPYHTQFTAVDHVSFQVNNGHTLGIIGLNGAGKSTLLKLLTGVLIADEGKMHIDGKITGLLELGTGFNAEMSGIQNIYMNGIFLGMTKDEIQSKERHIIDFAELGPFIHESLKTYSSGMVMRLAFAIAIHADPTCFVVDEALSVGDAHFQQKCMAKIREFRSKGGSIIFVSHDMNAVKMLCDDALLLHKGAVIERGTPEQVVNSYNYFVSKIRDTENKIVNTDDQKRTYGTFEVHLIEVQLQGKESRSEMISSGEEAVIRIVVKANDYLDDVTVGICIDDKYGQNIFGTNTYYYDQKIILEKDTCYEITFTMIMNIGPGKYTLTVALHSQETHVERCYVWSSQVMNFEVAGNRGASFIGVCKLYPEIDIHKI